MKRKVRLLSLAAASLIALAGWSATRAQTAQEAAQYKRVTGPQTLNPGSWPEHWPYADEYDSAVAASEVHHLRYVDSKVRFVEVAYFPGVHGQMHGHPYPSVFAVDAPTPKGFNVSLDPDNKPDMGRNTAPQGMAWPSCQTMGPQAPHSETNQDTWPHHFYRLEYLRVDGTGIQENWKSWYPHMLDPEIAATKAKPTDDAILSAPNTNRLLYEDNHMRLVEVTIRPDETEAMHADIYPAVIALDASSGVPALEDKLLDPSSPNNGQTSTKATGSAPKGFPMMGCYSSAPRAPHAYHNSGNVPVHWYRIEFKRIDGDGLATHWREWYPWMGKLTDEYAAHPYTKNF